MQSSVSSKSSTPEPTSSSVPVSQSSSNNPLPSSSSSTLVSSSASRTSSPDSVVPQSNSNTPSSTSVPSSSNTPSLSSGATPSNTPSRTASSTSSRTTSRTSSATSSTTADSTPSVTSSTTAAVTPSTTPDSTPSSTPSETASVTPSTTPSEIGPNPFSFCEGTKSFDLTDPNGELGCSGYANNAMISWTITSGSTIYLEFEFFELENCCIDSDSDFVEIYHGTDTSGTLIGRFTEFSPPPPIESTVNALHIVFTSDSEIFEVGFRGLWDNQPIDLPPDNTCQESGGLNKMARDSIMAKVMPIKVAAREECNVYGNCTIERGILETTVCSGGMAGTFPCNNVDLLAHVSLSDLGCNGAEGMFCFYI